MSEPVPPKVFISYSHKDADALERLKVHLKPQERAGLVDRWDDTRIQSGQDWDAEIKTALAAANIAVLIISADFLASDYIDKNELPPLLEAAEKEGLVVLSVLLKPCRFKQTHCLARYQTVNPPSQPWSAMSEHEREALWLKVTEDIDKALARPRRTVSPSGAAAAKPWNVPARNPLFTGRDDLLASLHAELTRDRRAILSGLGGIGKTQVAIAYAHRHRDAYRAAFFLRAETETDLIAGFVGIAGLVSLPERDAQNQRLAVVAVQRWLEENSDWLLIADNADDLPLACRFLPRDAPGGCVLLTSREPATLSFAPPTKVLPMDEDTGAGLLLQRAGQLPVGALLENAPAADLAAARELSRTLGGLPLALEQAGAFIEEMSSSPAEYLTLYRKEDHARRLRAWQSTVATPEHDTVAVTFTLAFEKVAAASPTAADLLRLCAFLAPEDIPESLFIEGAAALEPPLASAFRDDLRRSEIVGAATRYSLLYRKSRTQTLSLHRQVQAVLRDGLMERQESRPWIERVVSLVARAFPAPPTFPTWQACEALLPHALACAALVIRENLESELAATLLQLTGLYLEDRVRNREVEPLYIHAQKIREKILGSEHPDTAIIYNDLGALYSHQGKSFEAELLHQRALAIREAKLGANHPETALSLGNLAAVYHQQEKYLEAESLLQRALIIREMELGFEHRRTAVHLSALGAVYTNLGKFPEAERMLRRALDIQEKTLSTTDPDTANSLTNMGALYHREGRLTDAEPLLQRALSIRESSLGPDHPDIADSLHNLAGVFHSKGKFGKAEQLYWRALAVKEKAFGAKHLSVAVTLENLAMLLEKRGRTFTARPLIQRAKAIRAAFARRQLEK